MGYTALAFASLALLSATAGLATHSAWVDLFTPPYNSGPTIMLAISCVDVNNCWIPGGSNGIGFDVFHFDGQVNGNFTGLLLPTRPLMMMAIAVGGTGKNPVGAVGGVEIPVIATDIQYFANSSTMLPSLVLDAFVASQDAHATKDGQHIILVNDGTPGGVLYSNNGGKTFSARNIPANFPVPAPNCTSARYGALVDSKTFYITMGSWPYHKKSRDDGVYEFSERVNLVPQGNGGMKRVVKSMLKKTAAQKEALGSSGSGSSPSSGSSDSGNGGCGTGYSAQIVKTTDGGNTWTTVYSSAKTFYFNAIDCASATRCVAVGEGNDAGAGIHIYLTEDGTTFKQVFSILSTATTAYSLAAVGFLTATEVWAAGSAETQTGSNGIFFRSTDGGKTWAEFKHQQPNIAEFTDLSFTPDGFGFATAITVFQDSTVLRYGHNAPGPNPPGTYFEEAQCPFAGCTLLCQNVSFPLGQCLPLNGGGSALASCQPTQLMQQIFNTTDCTGPSQSAGVALNQCVKDSQGSFFEVYCGGSGSTVRRPANHYWDLKATLRRPMQ